MGSKGKEPKPPVELDRELPAESFQSLGQAITPVILRLRGGFPRLRIAPPTADREEDRGRGRT